MFLKITIKILLDILNVFKEYFAGYYFHKDKYRPHATK